MSVYFPAKQATRRLAPCPTEPRTRRVVVFAGTSTILFAIVNAAKIVPYWQLRQFAQFDVNLASWIVPAAIIGSFVGRKLTKVIPDKLFFRLVEIALLGLSIKLILDYVSAAG
ncbi:sulfite exporter TauE/SafE family protein [Rhizobium sp. BK399]|uniref:sulfite exporter TauE/SafE family protein n=1 Tax=Rhizobium sp. BK399 TaxID=2587063 RepID=UPI00161C4B11|nr:sulfite exporter TauE/SafE family protein [Rhizobium sp. BK399]MBB3543505.1 putative membrane protein YfcA [Rhizobium sp. BK399]